MQDKLESSDNWETMQRQQSLHKLIKNIEHRCVEGAIGYSWLEGLLIEPLVRGSNPSGARVQWVEGC